MEKARARNANFYFVWQSAIEMENFSYRTTYVLGSKKKGWLWDYTYKYVGKSFMTKTVHVINVQWLHGGKLECMIYTKNKNLPSP